MKCLILMLVAALMISGCSAPKLWTATGGSRADAVVRLSYQYVEFESPVLEETQAVAVASKRCQTWGYSGAEAFGGEISQCVQGGGLGGCSKWTVTKEYQCLGTGSSAAR